MWRVSAAAIAGIFSSSCAQVPPSKGDVAASCPVTDSKNWAAWVNAMPGPDARAMLIVTGEVMVPSGGYSAQMELGPLAKADPPSQEVLLQVMPPKDGANLAVMGLKVRGEFPALGSYGKVTVRCGDRTLAEITSIERVY